MKSGWLTTLRISAVVLLASLCALAVFSMALAFLVVRGPNSNRFVVHNASALDLTEVHVVLRHMDGRVAIDRMLSALAAGSSATMTHTLNDSEAFIEFRIGGSLQRFATGYIDLWRGEGWVLEIQADGSVKQGYDYPGFELQ